MLGSDSPAPIKKRIGIFALSSYFYLKNQGLSEINSDLSKHTLGTPHGFSSGETYVATDDGYVILFSNGGFCEVYIGATGTINAFKGTYASRNAVFVKKGMSMRYYTEDASTTACTFFPLV